MRAWYALATYEDPKPYRRRQRIMSLFLLAALVASGCSNVTYQAPPIGEGLVAFTARDATNAAANFSAAGYTVEAQCMTDVAARLTALPGASMQFVVSGLLSGGAVGYIDAKALLSVLGQGGTQLSPACLQVVGNVVVSVAMFRALQLPSVTPGK